MKKLYTLLLVALALLLVPLTQSDASSATTYTFAINAKGFYTATQDAYLPDRTILDIGLDEPEDIFIDENDYLFIADTGNRRIVVYDPETDVVLYEITHEDFSSPRGIFITQDNELYVADSVAQTIFKFNTDGTFIESYGKPTSASYGSDAFNPKKIAVDNQDNMFVIAEGIYSGIIQLSNSGEFQGYFATNDVQLTAKQRLENMLFSEEQLDQVSDRNPISFSNIYVDQNGLKYSTSFGDDIDNLKKHNTDGSSSIDTDYGVDLELLDVYTDSEGIIYTASDKGFINIFTSDGSYIFGFGENPPGSYSSVQDYDVAGLYTSLEAIAVDSDGRIWTLDSTKSFIQSYTPTEYTTKIYSALALYSEGKYSEAVVEWKNVLRLNQLSVIAHNEIGKNLYSQGEYEESMYHFELAGNRGYYSQAYWEVRNQDLQANLPYALLGFLIFIIAFYTVKFTNKKYHYLEVPKKKIKEIGNIRIINDILYMFNLIKHPIDSFYYIKKKEKGSYKGATIIFAIFFTSYMIYVTSKGFIYQFVEASDLDLNAIILGFFGLVVLFILCNYLVTSINDGEGSLGEIYKGTMYSTLPLIIAYLLATFLSYYFTYNEVFILDLIINVGMAWSALLVFIAIQELHNYTIRESIKSLLLTFLFMAIAAVIFAFIQIMGDQLIQFVIAFVKEAIRNVFN